MFLYILSLERLVIADLIPRCLGTYIPILSNFSFKRALGWCLVLRLVSSLDAFSCYPLVRSCSACLVRQPIHQRHRITVPFVLSDPSSQTPTLLADIEQTVSRRFEPSSRSLLMGEHPHPWPLLHGQVR